MTTMRNNNVLTDRNDEPNLFCRRDFHLRFMSTVIWVILRVVKLRIRQYDQDKRESMSVGNFGNLSN